MKHFLYDGIASVVKTDIEISPDQLLANAIVAYAAVDYINALISNDISKILSSENFFKSEAYQIYTNVSAKYLMDMCKSVADECIKNGRERYSLNHKI